MKPDDLLRRLRRRASRLGLDHSERQGKGSHLMVRHGGRTTVVSRHPGDMGEGLLRKIVVKDLGLTLTDLED